MLLNDTLETISQDLNLCAHAPHELLNSMNSFPYQLPVLHSKQRSKPTEKGNKRSIVGRYGTYNIVHDFKHSSGLCTPNVLT